VSDIRNPLATDCQAPKKTLKLRRSVPSLLQSHTLLSRHGNFNSGIRDYLSLRSLVKPVHEAAFVELFAQAHVHNILALELGGLGIQSVLNQ
jgi:hypothetical protein